MAFSSDGQTLATGGWDQTARLWVVATHQLLGTLTGDTNWVNAVAFSPDGRPWPPLERTAQYGCGMLPPNSRLALLSPTAATDHSLAFSPDGQTLATGNGDDAAQLWNVSYLTDCHRTYVHQQERLSIAPNGRPTCRAWRIKTSALISAVSVTLGTKKGENARRTA